MATSGDRKLAVDNLARSAFVVRTAAVRVSFSG
jgi:hypothetical protein